MVSECSWYVEDSKEEKATKKERKSICEQSKSRSLSLTEYIPSRARVSPVCGDSACSPLYMVKWDIQRASFVVCVHSRYGSRYLTVYKQVVQHTKKPIEEERVFWRWRRSPDIVYCG